MIIYILLILVLIVLIYIYNKQESFTQNNLGEIARYDSNNVRNQCGIAGQDANLNNGLFSETKFHEDYRDVITAFGNVVPPKDHVFNISSLPFECTEINKCDVEKLANQFITLVNANNRAQVPATRNAGSGWDEVIPNPNQEPGWAKAMKTIGIPPSLYPEPASKSDLKLIKILKATKYETIEESKYVIKMIVQKMNVDDQMMLSLTVIVNNKINEDDFNKKNIQKEVIIENVSILGFTYKTPTMKLSSGLKCDTKALNKCNNTQLYSEPKSFLAEEMTDDYRLIDATTIQDELMKNYNKHQREMENRLATLDHEGRNFYKTLPPIYTFDNIKCTQTIFDDMNEDKVFN